MARFDEKSYLQYEVFPKIIKKNTKTKITISPLLKLPLDDGRQYKLIVSGMMEHDGGEYLIYPKDGKLEFAHTFFNEQEYSVKFYRADMQPVNAKVYSIVYLYCVGKDLFALRPYKGDFHLHSQRSDGHESPAGVCAIARKAGLDFWALTDHRKYKPSLEAMNAYEGVETEGVIFPGEEVHFHELGHVIAFGGEYGLGEKYDDPEYDAEYKKELSEYEAKLKKDIENLPDWFDKDEYIKWRHVTDEVRKTGALAVMAHPFWMMGDHIYHTGQRTARYLLESGCFDAFELLNGDYADMNPLQILMWQEMRGDGRYIPLVSGTDAHSVLGDDYFGKFYTVAFMNEVNMSEIKDAVKGERTVVVCDLAGEHFKKNGGTAQVFGHFRLSAFTLYLLREVFPLHDEICAREGYLMSRHLSGDADAGKQITENSNKIKKLYEKLWRNFS